MNPPNLPPMNHTTTTQILIQSTKIMSSHISTFLLLSLLLLTFRSNVRHSADYLSSFLDNNPSLKSLITRIDNTPPPPLHPHHLPPSLRRRRPFLHLTRVGTLDDDFFSSDSEFDKSLFNPRAKSPTNHSFLILGFSSPVVDNGIAFKEAVRNEGFLFRSPLDLYEYPNNGFDVEKINKSDSAFVEGEGEGEGEMLDLRFLLGFPFFSISISVVMVVVCVWGGRLFDPLER